MNINAVIIGVNEWAKYTLPAVLSIEKNDPDLNIILVDNGSQPPYGIKNVNIVRLEETVCYAAALNAGIHADKADWYVLLNNDILLRKPIAWRFEDLDPAKFYGFYLWDKPGAMPEITYLSGWCMLLSHQVFELIGDFDENLRPMYFEDADYSYRCTKAGVPLVSLDRDDWGIYHIEDERHKERRQYMIKHQAERKANRDYLRKKHGL